MNIEYRNNGSIVLSGTVGNAADRRRAEAAALGAHGVSRVDNQLQVAQLATAPGAVPETSASGVSQRILASVQDEVKNGWYQLNVGPAGDLIELSGFVDNEETRRRILDVVGRVSPLPVKDRLALRPAKPDTEVELEVSRMLARDFPALAPKLSIDVDSGTVRLMGDVADHWDIDQVLASVVMLDGVRQIDSRVTINGNPYHSSGMIPYKK
jgi:osmotically-inducible protein OsmY